MLDLLDNSSSNTLCLDRTDRAATHDAINVGGAPLCSVGLRGIDGFCHYREFSFSESLFPGVTLSLTPSIAPSLFFFEPPSRSSSMPAVSVCDRSRRLTASAKRRYVSTLAITM